MPDVSNTGVPKVFSGPRARFKLNSVTVAYAGGVSGEESIDYQPVDVLDLLEVKEHVPVAYRATLNAQMFRIINNSLKAQGVFPTTNKILTSESMTADIEDAEITGKTVQHFIGVRTAGHTFDVTARGLVSENVSFVCIKTFDESEAPMA